MRLVDRVADCVASIAADHEAAALRHERGHVSDRAADDDVEALERDATACAGVAAHDEQAAATGRAGRLAGVPVDDDRSRHHVLRQAGAGIPAHVDHRPLVHPCAVVADVARDLDVEGRVEPTRDRVRAVRVQDLPVAGLRVVAGEVVQALVQLPQRRRREIDDGRAGRRRRHRASSFSHA